MSNYTEALKSLTEERDKLNETLGLLCKNRDRLNQAIAGIEWVECSEVEIEDPSEKQVPIYVGKSLLDAVIHCLIHARAPMSTDLITETLGGGGFTFVGNGYREVERLLDVGEEFIYLDGEGLLGWVFTHQQLKEIEERNEDKDKSSSYANPILYNTEESNEDEDEDKPGIYTNCSLLEAIRKCLDNAPNKKASVQQIADALKENGFNLSGINHFGNAIRKTLRMDNQNTFAWVDEDVWTLIYEPHIEESEKSSKDGAEYGESNPVNASLSDAVIDTLKNDITNWLNQGSIWWSVSRIIEGVCENLDKTQHDFVIENTLSVLKAFPRFIENTRAWGLVSRAEKYRHSG